MTNKSTLSIAWLLSYISIASVSAAMITPALPAIERSFVLSAGAVEWMVSAFLIGYVIGQLVYGPLANVYGRLKALKWGLNINILGLALCIVATIYPDYALLLFGRFITGLGSAAGLTCTFMLINEWLPPEQRKTAMAYSILSFALGSGFAVLIGGLITQYIHWQGCFIFLLIQAAVMRSGIHVFDETLIKSKLFHIPSLLGDYAKALTSRKLLTFSMIWGASTSVSYCFSAAAPQIAHHYLNLSASEYGYWNIINILGMLLGGLSAKELMNRFSIPIVLMVGYIGSALALLSLMIMLSLNNQNAFWFFMSTCLLYCFSSCFFAGGAYMASNAIEDRASASSMMSFINMGVATLSVIIMGYLSLNPFYGFLGILTGVFSVTLLLLIVFQTYSTRNSALIKEQFE